MKQDGAGLGSGGITMRAGRGSAGGFFKLYKTQKKRGPFPFSPHFTFELALTRPPGVEIGGEEGKTGWLAARQESGTWGGRARKESMDSKIKYFLLY